MCLTFHIHCRLVKRLRWMYPLYLSEMLYLWNQSCLTSNSSDNGFSECVFIEHCVWLYIYKLTEYTLETFDIGTCKARVFREIIKNQIFSPMKIHFLISYPLLCLQVLHTKHNIKEHSFTSISITIFISKNPKNLNTSFSTLFIFLVLSPPPGVRVIAEHCYHQNSHLHEKEDDNQKT